jgi:hypothetical protein
MDVEQMQPLHFVQTGAISRSLRPLELFANRWGELRLSLTIAIRWAVFLFFPIPPGVFRRKVARLSSLTIIPASNWASVVVALLLGAAGAALLVCSRSTSPPPCPRFAR